MFWFSLFSIFNSSNILDVSIAFDFLFDFYTMAFICKTSEKASNKSTKSTNQTYK